MVAYIDMQPGIDRNIDVMGKLQIWICNMDALGC